MRSDSSHQAVERVVRESYGRLIAFLTARSRDIAASEDALSDALLTALERWPVDGIPNRPEAWLLTAARRRLIDESRRRRVSEDARIEMVGIMQSAEAAFESLTFPDERLKLLFACAHPAIASDVRTPLMLQTVLGLDAATIAAAFLIPPATMGQRLVRMKAKLRDAGVPFSVPEPERLPERLGHVLDAVYAAFGAGWEESPGGTDRASGLVTEAIWLARMLVALLPEEPETYGLLALFLHCEARRKARRAPDGAYVPLSEQNPDHWDMGLIEEAERMLTKAARFARPGRFQLEAAIQSVHAFRAVSGTTNWPAVALFYEKLVRIHPSLGAFTGRAAAIGRVQGPMMGLAALEGLEDKRVSNYQPYWAVRAHFLADLGRHQEAELSFERAIALCDDRAVREFLIGKMKTGRQPLFLPETDAAPVNPD